MKILIAGLISWLIDKKLLNLSYFWGKKEHADVAKKAHRGNTPAFSLHKTSNTMMWVSTFEELRK